MQPAGHNRIYTTLTDTTSVTRIYWDRWGMRTRPIC